MTIEQAREYAAEIAGWDRRIVEIIALGVLEQAETLSLVCTFEPEPTGNATGFFWVVNLMVRDEYEQLGSQVGLKNSVDLGFMIGENIYLPGGEIIATPADHTKLWPEEQE